MLPQVNLNFGAIAFDRIYQFFLPLVPGLVFVGGFLIVRPDLQPIARQAFGFGVYVGLLVLFLAAYVVGTVLYGLSTIVMGVLSGITLGIVFRFWNPRRNNLLLSQRPVWRRVAARFLGELAPVPPQPPSTSTPVDKALAPLKELADTRSHDEEWQEWYDVLQDYLLRDVPLISNDTLLALLGMQATGWAILGLFLVRTQAMHWAVLSIAGLFVLFGALSMFLLTVSYATSDRLTYWAFTARLLSETRAGEPSPGVAPQALRMEGKRGPS